MQLLFGNINVTNSLNKNKIKFNYEEMHRTFKIITRTK